MNTGAGRDDNDTCEGTPVGASGHSLMPIRTTLKQTAGRFRFRVSQFVHRAKWSGDLMTLFQFYRSGAGERVVRARFNGGIYSLHVRGGTLDAAIFEQIVCEGSEYRLPIDLQPKVIFDVGANIGAAAVYFAARYPQAKVYCFEPLPENLDLLRRNVSAFGDRVMVVPMGLGDTEGTFEYRPSDDPTNFGGGTFHSVGCADSDPLKLPVTTLAKFCREHPIEKIDVMKIDTEGAEWSVLSGMSPKMLAGISVLLGELHGIDDGKMIQVLSTTHELGYDKPLGRSCYPFWAVKRSSQQAEEPRLAA